MTRRDAAWLIARASAVAGGATFFADWVNAQHAAPPEADRWKSYRPAFFTAGQYQILDAFTSILIPADETPGARDAQVAPFIDFVVNAAAEFAPETQAEWRHAMGWLGLYPWNELREVKVIWISSGGGSVKGWQAGAAPGTSWQSWRDSQPCCW